MWFKNLRIYRLGKDIAVNETEFESALAEWAFVPCGRNDSRRIGWIPPLGTDAAGLTHTTAGCVMVAARDQEKLLPAAVISEQLDEQVLEIELKEGRKIGRGERRRIKDELLHTLLPRALTRSRRTYAFLVPTRRLLFVDSGSAARAEELLDLLRASLGSLEVRPLQPRHDPSEQMTRWLTSGKSPKEFLFGGDCDLRDPLDKANVVRCRAQELISAEIRSHLDAGKRCHLLGLVWAQRVAFQLGEDLGLRRLRFTDMVTGQAQLEDVDEAVQFDSDFAIQSGELLGLTDAMIALFGEIDEERTGK